MRSGSRNEAGFSLVEVLIALGVLLVGMTGVLALFTTALGLQARAVERQEIARESDRIVLAIQDDLTERLTGGGEAVRITGVEFPVPGQPRMRYIADIEPMPDDAGGRGVFAAVRLLVRERGRDREYDLGALAIIPRPDTDALIRELRAR